MKKANDEQNQFVQKLENLSVRLDHENLLWKKKKKKKKRY